MAHQYGHKGPSHEVDDESGDERGVEGRGRLLRVSWEDLDRDEAREGAQARDAEPAHHHDHTSNASKGGGGGIAEDEEEAALCAHAEPAAVDRRVDIAVRRDVPCRAVISTWIV